MRLDAGTVTNCIFDSNYAGFGGAIYLTGGQVSHCQFVNNGSYLRFRHWGGVLFIQIPDSAVPLT